MISKGTPVVGGWFKAKRRITHPLSRRIVWDAPVETTGMEKRTNEAHKRKSQWLNHWERQQGPDLVNLCSKLPQRTLWSHYRKAPVLFRISSVLLLLLAAAQTF